MPLFTAFFAYFILVEKLNVIEKVSLIISFVGVFVLIEGGK
jgi:drug/metabolite transporter (DMT)-like permease